MCKNADNPCPGCGKHKQAESPWMFFTDEERQALESLSAPQPPARPAARP